MDNERLIALTQRFDDFILATQDWRKAKKELDEKVLAKVDAINDRCLKREGLGCISLQQHTAKNGKEKEYRRTLWDTRSFQIIVIVLTVVVTNIVGYAIKCVFGGK